MPPLLLPTRRDTDVKRTDTGRLKDSIRWKVNSSALLGRGHREGQASSGLSLWMGDRSASECASCHLSLLERTPQWSLVSPTPSLFFSQPHPCPGLSTKGSRLSFTAQGLEYPDTLALPC